MLLITLLTPKRRLRGRVIFGRREFYFDRNLMTAETEGKNIYIYIYVTPPTFRQGLLRKNLSFSRT